MLGGPNKQNIFYIFEEQCTIISAQGELLRGVLDPHVYTHETRSLRKKFRTIEDREEDGLSNPSN